MIPILGARQFGAMSPIGSAYKALWISGVGQVQRLSIFTGVACRLWLVHCQEGVEHIEEVYLDHLINSMLSGKVILMSHALPGQQGHHHVNLKPQEYWVAQMRQRGATWLEEDTRRIRVLAKDDGASFMAQTGLIFVNRARL